MDTSHPPMVGRVTAARDLVEAVDRACTGAGCLVLVTGEPGVGKSRLVAEIAEAVADRMDVGWGAGGAAGAAGSFRAWIQALGSLDPDGTAVGQLASAVEPAEGIPVEGRESARLQLFDEVAGFLRARARQRPIVVVLDDVHLAERSTLALLAFLAPPLHTAPIVILATAWPDDPALDEERSELLRLAARHAQVIALAPLEASATGALIEALSGVAPTDTVVAAIHARTGGNPLFVTELVRLLDARGQLDLSKPAEGSVPASVREIVTHRLATMSDAGRTLLKVAAILGLKMEDDLLEAAAMAVDPDLDVSWALQAAEKAHLIARDGPYAHRFTHAMFREAIHDQMGSADRRALHATVARVLEAAREAGRDVPPGQIAAHLAATGDPADRPRAIELLHVAAEAAAAVHAHEDATTQLDQALALARHDTGTDAIQAELLLARGDACLALGDLPASREAFRAAADRARAAGRPVLLARAAVGLGSGEVGFEVPLFDQLQLRLLEEALAALPSLERAWASRIRARLSVALSFTEDEARRVELSTSAIAAARASDDDGALAAALAAHCDTMAGPADSEQREQEAGEVIRLARRRGDLRTELLGRRLRLVARLEQGDMTGAGADIETFTELADRLGEPLFSWYPPLWQAMLRLLVGRADDAGRHTERARWIGAQAQSVNAQQLSETQRWWLAIETSDHERLEQVSAGFDGQLPPATWARVAVALTDALLGQGAAARVLFDRLVEELPSEPLDSEWLPMLAQVAEAVEIVGPHPVAAWAYSALLPYRQRHVVEGIGAVMRGSVERFLGILAAAARDPAAAEGHFDAALAANRRLGGPGLVARTLRDAGVALDRTEMLEAAASLYAELGWHHRVQEVRQQLDQRAADQAVGRTGGQDTKVPIGTFRLEADGWHLRWHDVSVRLRDVKGLHDIAWLLARPGRETPALDLLTATAPGRWEPLSGDDSAMAPEGDLGEVVDAQARASYRQRLAELEQEIVDADEAFDRPRREHAEAERDFLVRELATAYGLHGRIRRPGAPAERARTTVTSRVRYAIARVATAHPELGHHLTNSVRTGRFCSYMPETPVDWEL